MLTITIVNQWKLTASFFIAVLVQCLDYNEEHCKNTQASSDSISGTNYTKHSSEVWCLKVM